MLTTLRERAAEILRILVRMSLCLALVHQQTLAGLAAGMRAKQTEVVLEQVIPREDPLFSCASARLTVGRDGLVYLCGTSDNHFGFVERMTHDGKEKFGGTVVYAAANATANGNGIVATANGHFAHKVTLYDKSLNQFAEMADFDSIGFDAPDHVECGPSGDFYGADQHRDRIVRLSPAGKLLKAYSIPRDKQGKPGLIQDFRVCEKTESFYVWTLAGQIRCIGFDGQKRWTYAGKVAGGEGDTSSFDVDDDGVFYALAPRSDTVMKVGADGETIGEIKLQMAENKPGRGEPWFTALRVAGKELLLKRRSDTELFQRYALESGDFAGIVNIDHERLTVSFPAGTWTAGQAIPFHIKLESPSGTVPEPHWRVWAKVPGSSFYREFPIQNGMLQVPMDAAGIYQLKVTPELTPVLKGTPSEYLVHGWIEIGQPGARGTVSVWTPSNRVYYGRGEEIPFSVSLRSADADKGVPVTVRLMEAGSPPGSTPAAVGSATLAAGDRPLSMTLPGSLTAALKPGRYEIKAVAPELTCVSQPLVIGAGMSRTPLQFIQYGDYSTLYPSGDVWDAPDRVATHCARTSKLGLNMLVDRLGSPVSLSDLSGKRPRDEVQEINKRLGGDPLAVAPEKVDLAPALLQTMSAYSAQGTEQMAILMMNDAGLPLGNPYDRRTLPQLTDAINKVTQTMSPYPAFRGWSWSSNWWVFGKRGADAAKTDEEKADYLAAVKKARETGAWDPVLDRVAGYRLGYAVDAQAEFNKKLKEIAPLLVTASAAPYRNVDSYPPISFSNVDEVDLQAQWEQISMPYNAPHGVDFYKRPGKRAWMHPEVCSDAGTGDQILPILFQGLMRGADGVGLSARIPNWGTKPEDSRMSYQGTPSVLRAMGELLRNYGPWLSSLENNDRVAIVVSGRMLKIDDWVSVMGRHFARLFEAYATCMFAHHPASIVFVDDLKPDTLERFKAILVVGQTVEMEPALAEALQNARKKGVAIFHDSTCRPALVKDFNALGIAFDQFENDPQPASDDAAYWRFPEYCRKNLPRLQQALDSAVAPVARVDNNEVFLSERKAEEGRYLFVVNDTTPKLEIGQMWRMTLAVTSRVPVKEVIHCPSESRIVYDVFAGKRVTELGSKEKQVELSADCRTLPARIFALLPAAVAQVEVRGPKGVDAGSSFAWSVQVQDNKGKPIRASVPLRVRLLSSSGDILEERFTAASSRGASGVFQAAINGPDQAHTLEATELLSGKTGRLVFSVKAGQVAQIHEASLAREQAAPPTRVIPVTAAAIGKEPVTSCAATENLFGPHLRDLAVADDGRLAVINAMNWDNNLYAVDTATGKLRWRQRVGNYFAFAPQGIQKGFAVQGFDFRSAEGYHLYLGGTGGDLERRFALYGVPARLPHRFLPFVAHDRINQFAVPENVSWVATAGNLGLAVWSRQGKLLWSQDWWKSKREDATLAALDADTLLVVKEMQAIAHSAITGKPLWRIQLAKSGQMREIRTSRDGKTCALLTTSSGGRVFVLRDGKLLTTIPTSGLDLALAPDGAHLAVNDDNQLKLYSVADGLRWVMSGDDTLHFPRFSSDSRRIAVSSELGTVSVFDLPGTLKFEQDFGALTVPGWLPDGDLLLATWMGTVCRLDPAYRERWRTHLQPEAADMRGKLLSEDSTPTVRVAFRGNAQLAAAPLAPNLISPNDVVIKFRGRNRYIDLQHPVAALVDGKPSPPETPWLRWTDIGRLSENAPLNYLLLDTYRTRVRVNAITLVEDAAHPESWLRDASLEYWDPGKEQWVLAQALLSDTAVHTHKLASPIEASRFRIVMPWGLCGNLRLGEIVLHGEKIGPSHPDAAAKRPVAVLFDEGDDLKEPLVQERNGLKFQFDGAYSGGRCLALSADRAVTTPYEPPFGQGLPNWNFEIAEKPGPGQYRYLQFAWKAAPGTRSIVLQLGEPATWQQVACYAGEYAPAAGSKPKKIADVPPTDWQVVRVDLWEFFRKPMRVQALALSNKGGITWFDQIVLGRTEKDLPGKK